MTTLDSGGGGTNITTAPYSIFGYTGRIYDSTMLLEYDNARYYDPTNGRFISPDPSGTGSDANLYRYGHDDPIDRSDYNGEDDILDGGDGGGGDGGGSVIDDGGGDGGDSGDDGGGIDDSGSGSGAGTGQTDYDDGSGDTVSQPAANLPDTTTTIFDDDDTGTAGTVDLGTPDQYSSIFDGYSSTDISLDDAPTPSDAELDDLDLSGLGEDDFDAAMSTAFSDQDVSDPFADSSVGLSADLNNFDSDFGVGGSLGLAGTLGTDGLYDQSWSSAFWSAALGDDDDLGISNVTQPAWIDDTATASRDVGIGALTLATGGLAGGAVEALGIGGGLGSILTGAASGAASSFTLSTLARATETGGFNLSLVDPGETAYDTALGLGTGGLLGGALFGANVFGSDAASWLSSFGDNSSGLALAGGGVDGASSALAGIGESVSPGWVGAVGGSFSALFSMGEDGADDLQGAAEDAVQLEGFSDSEAAMIKQAQSDLANAGYNPSQLQQLVKADMPAGYRGMSLSPNGAALSNEAFSSQAMLNHVMEEELIHLGQNLPAQTFGPGTMSQIEGAANAARKFPLPTN